MVIRMQGTDDDATVFQSCASINMYQTPTYLAIWLHLCRNDALELPVIKGEALEKSWVLI